MRVFTVPRGCCSRSATSACVNPSKYASSIAAFCRNGSASRAARTPRLIGRVKFQIGRDRSSRKGLDRRGMLLLGHGLAASRTQPVDCATPRQDQQPGHDGAARGVIACRVPPCLREHVLHNLFSIRLFPKDAEGQREDGAAVPIIELRESGAIAVRHAVHGRDVCGGALVGRPDAVGSQCQ